MGNFKGAYTGPIRIYDDPQHPDTSDYYVFLPEGTSAGVYDPTTGASVFQQISNIKGAKDYIGKISTPTADVTQQILNDYAASKGHTTPGDGMVIIDGGNADGNAPHDWRYDVAEGAWVDLGNSMVALATNNSPGIVQGSEETFEISVNSDGTMSVNGLDDSFNDVADGVDNVAALIGKPGDAAGSGGLTLFALIKWIVAQISGFITTSFNTLLGRVDTTVSSRASQASVDTLQTGVNTTNANMTAARASNMDVAVSTRASQVSVGSSGDAANSSGSSLFALEKYIASMFDNYYTPGRAAYLDRLSTGGMPIIKSVQRGVYTLPLSSDSIGYVYISPVTPGKCSATITGPASSIGTSSFRGVFITNLSSTALSFSWDLSLGAGSGTVLRIGWEVVEFY